MSGDFQVTLTDIKVQLADSVLESAFLRRELEKAQNANSIHRRQIEQLTKQLEASEATALDE